MLWILLSIVTLAFSSPAPAGPVLSSAPAVAVPETAALPSSEDSPHRRAGFELRVAGEPIPYDVMAAFALPGEELALEITSADSGFEVGADAGDTRELGTNRWTWQAPTTPGTYPIRIAHPDGQEAITLNVFVMVPYNQMKKGVLAGYRIGEYPLRWKQGTAGYDRPRGFVQVNAENEDVLVAPHFKLGQFVCKQGRGYPKYVVLRPALLVKLERLLEVGRENGLEANTFNLMSAYRTPVYNEGIGNKTSFSRHQYGDAADILVDDLNGDGRGDRRDAQLLSRWAEEIERSPEGDALAGGLSVYGSTEAHGPFVHVDARGYAARW